MNRPYTICFLACSADGKIDGEFMGAPEFGTPIGIYRQRWLDMNADATVYGAVTMAQFAAGWLKGSGIVCKAEHPYPRTDFIAPCDADKYFLAIDPAGTVAYDSKYIDKKGRGMHGIIHALTENVSDDYLCYLRGLDISYIFCGRETFDPVVMMEKAYGLFGIKKAIMSGGAYADWTLILNGLIDEMTVLLAPVVDGNPTAHPMFLRSAGMPAMSVGMQLVKTEVTEGDGLFVTYHPKNARPND